MRHADSSSQHLVGKTEHAERADAVPGKIEACTARRPRGCPLDDFGIQAVLAQRSGERKTRNSAADNQDA
jgi:hypothetical protein